MRIPILLAATAVVYALLTQPLTPFMTLMGIVALLLVGWMELGYARDRKAPAHVGEDEPGEREYLLNQIDHSEQMSRHWNAGTYVALLAGVVLLYAVLTGN